MLELIFLCGAPSSGKSTMAAQMMTSGSVQYVISPGYWLRHLMASKTETNDLANYISNNWNNDILEPIVREHVEAQIAEVEQKAQRIVIEGYPRTVTEAKHCVRLACKYPTSVIALDLSLEESRARAKKRNRSGDDKDESVATRWQYWNATVDHMQKTCTDAHLPFVRVNASLPNTISSFTINPIQLSAEALPKEQEVSHAPSTFLENVSAQEHATIVQMHMRLVGTPNRKRQFCGSHPVSLDRSYMPRLRRYPYLCALKIDGQRLFCIIHGQRLYFLSRKLHVWRSKEAFASLQEFEGSLLDGELALNNLFVVIDVLVMRGQSVMQKPILDRLAASVPLGKLMFNANLRFRPQMYLDRTHLPYLLNPNNATNIEYRVDGVILQPAKLPYRNGIDYNLFKWKPNALNTADLLWGEDSQFYCRKTNVPQTGGDNDGDNEENDDDAEGIKTLDIASGVMLTPVSGGLHHDYRADLIPWLKPGVIVECGIVLDEQQNYIEWVPRNPRADKPFPNMDWVVAKILDSVKDNITEQELIEYCQEPTLPPSAVPSPPRIRRQLHTK